MGTLFKVLCVTQLCKERICLSSGWSTGQKIRSQIWGCRKFYDLVHYTWL